MLYQKMSERNRIVVRYRDGRLIKGYTHDFSPVKETFHLTVVKDGVEGEIIEVNTTELKAIFFVKSFEGKKDYNEKKQFSEVDMSNLRGMKIKVEFLDGEIIRGVSLGYSKQRKGFFIILLDPESNNERVYVIARSVKDVKLGSLAET